MEGAVIRTWGLLLLAAVGICVGWLLAGKAHSEELPSSLLSPNTIIPPERFEPGKQWQGRFHVIGRSPCWKRVWYYPKGDQWEWDGERCPPA